MRPRRGYVLLSVLWFLASGVTLATAAMLSARSGLATASNRAALLRAEWQAEECLARARAAMYEDKIEVTSTGEGTVFRQGLASRARVLRSALVAGCPGTLAMDPVGVGVSLQSVEGQMLASVLRNAGIPSGQTDSLVDAFLDWRDADDSVRAYGAEADWYTTRGLESPRNGNLVAVAELLSVRGFTEWFGPEGMLDLERHFTAEPDRVFLDAASSEVLAALPGFNDEAVARFLERQSRNAEPLRSLLEVLGGLSPESRELMTRSISELDAVATVAPAGWLLRARSSGVPGDSRAERLQVEIELRLALHGQSQAVTRRRVSP